MMKLSSLVVAVSVVVVAGAIGCKSAKQEAPAPASQAQPAAGAAQAGDPLSGKVVETMNSGGYTYVCIENSGRKTWVALPDTKVTVGQMIACQAGGEMKNFTSRTLNRTFDSIIFSPGVR
jgi:hypothetical protein